MDAKSFNIFISMVKEKVEGLKPYAQVQTHPPPHRSTRRPYFPQPQPPSNPNTHL